jgi:hypothetical protein
MSNRVRVRADGVFGVTSSNFDSVSTTLESEALRALPPIGSNEHADVTLYEDGATPLFEIVRVVSHAAGSDQATVVRSVGGALQSWPPGTRLVHAPTTEDFAPRGLLQAPAESLSGLSDEFDDELLSGWTRYSLNSAEIVEVETDGVLSIYHPGGDASAQAAHSWLKPISQLAYPFTVTLASRHLRRYATNYQMFGPIVTNGTDSTAPCLWMMPYASTATTSAFTCSTRTGTLGSISSTIVNETWEFVGGGRVWQRITGVSEGVWKTEYSVDGITWVPVPVTDFSHTLVPTHVGFSLSTWGIAVRNAVTVELFRTTGAS